MEPLGPLTVEYFRDKISYEGTNLTRQKSLASYHKIQNFWSIYHNVIKNKGSLEELKKIENTYTQTLNMCGATM